MPVQLLEMNSCHPETLEWLQSLDTLLPLTTQRVVSRRGWLNWPPAQPIPSGLIKNPSYPATEVHFVAESRGNLCPKGERPLIVCTESVHSEMIGLISISPSGRRFVLGVAKAEAGLAVHRANHPEFFKDLGDPYKGNWSITCAHQYSRAGKPVLPWLPDAKECEKRGLTLIANSTAFADPGMMAKIYRLGLVYAPWQRMKAIADEANHGDKIARWLYMREVSHLQSIGRVTEFLFTTLDLVGDTNLEDFLQG